jgi:hypothetical protein
MAVAVPKTCFAGEASAAFLSKVSILSSRIIVLALRAHVVIIAALAWGALVE